MLDETLVFHRTVLGQSELADPDLTLAPKARRALFLVDGKKDVSQLTPLFRSGEVDSILEDLQASGHITLDLREAAPPSGDGEPPRR